MEGGKCGRREYSLYRRKSPYEPLHLHPDLAPFPSGVSCWSLKKSMSIAISAATRSWQSVEARDSRILRGCQPWTGLYTQHPHLILMAIVGIGQVLLGLSTFVHVAAPIQGRRTDDTSHLSLLPQRYGVSKDLACIEYCFQECSNTVQLLPHDIRHISPQSTSLIYDDWCGWSALWGHWRAETVPSLSSLPHRAHL